MHYQRFKRTGSVELDSARSGNIGTRTRLIGDEQWMQYAACHGMGHQSFFFEPGQSHLSAIAVCAGCVVRNACLNYAMNNHIVHGVWGGKSERARHRLRATWLDRRKGTL